MIEDVYKRLKVALSYARKSYQDTHDRDEIFISNDITDAQVIISKNIRKEHSDFDAVVAFRGTSSSKDVIVDLDIRRNECDPAILGKNICSSKSANPLVHSGFLNQYMSLRQPMLKTLDSMTDVNNVLIASHSLGAALGTIAALDLTINRPNLNVCNITFGSPRVGNDDFSKLYGEKVKNTVRCVHGFDPVTMIPTPLRFRHVCDGFNLGRIIKGSGFFDYFRIVKDHNLDCYDDAIEHEFSVSRKK